MYDYDEAYRRVRAAGHPGWAGSRHHQNVARMAATLDRLEQESFPKPPAKVLELGCGNGMSASLLMARKGYEVHGVDISEAAIAWAREQFVECALSSTFHQGDVCEMPFLAHRSTDVVIDGSCLHCLIGNDRSRCLQEVHRILRLEGIFVVSSMCGVPKSDEAKARFDPLTSQLSENGRPYRTLKPLPDLVQELEGAGFGVQDAQISVNPWWDHAVMVCRIKDASTQTAGYSPAAQQIR
jgi:ubiquinone/menaquinone biosynthesis C-methylase UbiE